MSSTLRLSARLRPFWVGLLLLPLCLTPSLATFGDSHQESAEIAVDQWLVAGPVAMPMPAWSEETGVNAREALKLQALLPAWPYEAGAPWPEAGRGLAWPGDALNWESQSSAVVELGEGDVPGLGWVATFIEADRFGEVELEVATPHLVRVFFDGEQVAQKTSADSPADEEGGEGSGGEGGGEDQSTEAESAEPEVGRATATLKVTPGKHLLLLAALRDGDSAHPWNLEATLTPKAAKGGDEGHGKGADHEGESDSADSADSSTDSSDAAASPAAHVELAVSNSPARGVTVHDLLDPPQVSGVDVSADGTLLAVTLQQPAVPSDDRSSWVEIVRAEDGAPVRTLRLPGSLSGFSWAPTGTTFSYRTSDAGKTTLWLGDLETGRVEPLLRNVEGLRSGQWAPDGESLFVEISEEAEKDDRGAQRVRSLPDRWAGFRDLSHVHQVSTEDGRSRRLTAGAFSTSLEDVAPDGSRLLLSRTRFVEETPFVMGDLYELDLATLELGPAREVVWFGSASYAPDGERVLVLAGPSAFGELGLNIGAAAAPNEYDGQAYLLEMADDPADDRVTAITRDFDPAVNTALWSRTDDALYLLTTEGEYAPVYRWAPGRDGGRFSRLDAGPDVVSSLSVARAAGTLAYAGSSLQEPGAAWVMDSAKSEGRQVLAPSQEPFRQVRFGRVDDFSFTTEEGFTLPGRLYYPLDYDEEAVKAGKKYPLLTYYYGGVVPTTRSFAGRYPKNFWAANGYAVYVLQPSGAVGFGQERSAAHPNDWGERVVEEIVAGVDAVVDAHPFLDGDRVGAFGGSYGGFLAMRLVTDSNRFAASISHAGISGIASYWGEGWWGFLYMATAAHGSYPWNRPDVFVEQSPLFKADQVETPLLLLHGMSDPNVPPGESEQMFAALRVLGKDVEYIRIDGEAHWILSYPKRVLWWQTVLAWFDMHLKDQPEWWQELWGEDLDRTGP